MEKYTVKITYSNKLYTFDDVSGDSKKEAMDKVLKLANGSRGDEDIVITASKR